MLIIFGCAFSVCAKHYCRPSPIAWAAKATEKWKLAVPKKGHLPQQVVYVGFQTLPSQFAELNLTGVYCLFMHIFSLLHPVAQDFWMKSVAEQIGAQMY